MNSDIIIRNATKDDAMDIAGIIVEDWQIAYKNIIDDEYLSSLNVNNRYDIEVKRFDKYIVAADDSEVLGCAWLQDADEEDADCEIVALYVRYDKRNNGIGKKLLNEAVSRFKKQGKKKMIIYCLKDNHDSRKFYEINGGKVHKGTTHPWGGRDYDMISYLYDLEAMDTEDDSK